MSKKNLNKEFLKFNSLLTDNEKEKINNKIADERVEKDGPIRKAGNIAERAVSILGGGGNNIAYTSTLDDKRFIELAKEQIKNREKKNMGGILQDDDERYGMKDGGKGIEALRKEAPEVVKRMGYESGGLHSDFKKSNKSFIKKMAEAFLKDVKNTKDRDEYVRLSIQDKVKVADTLGLDFNEDYYIKEITKAQREMSEKSNPLLGTRQIKQEGGEIDNQMLMVMTSPQESEMESDDDMEDNYTKFIMEEALSEDEEDMLTSKLEQDEQLSMLFDKIIDVAQEFAGSGPVEGPGSGVSDSIPARLSDGEFVFTAKAVEEIGADKLMSMMKEAENAAEERQQAYGGGAVGDQLEKVVQTETRITKPADAMSPALGAKEDNMIQEEVTRNMLDPRVPHVRS